MSKYKEYFDSISPCTSDEEFANNVMASARRSKRKFKLITSSFAAAVMTLAFTVSAVWGMDIGAAVRSFFGDKDNITEGSVVDVNAVNTENTFDSLDISVKGAVRDENFTVIFLDIARTDNGFFDCAPYTYNVKNAEGNDMIASDEKLYPGYEFAFGAIEATYTDENGGRAGTVKNSAFRQYVVKDDNDMDGQITLAVCIDTSEPFFGMAEGRLACDKVKLGFGNFKGKKCSGRYSESGEYIILDSYSVLDMNGNFSCEIDLGDCRTRSRSVTGGGTASVTAYSHTNDPAEMEFADFDFNVISITVTSVSVSVKLDGSVPAETFYVMTNDFGSVVMNDGREISFGKYNLPETVKESGNIRHISMDSADDKWTVNAGFILPEAINIDDIHSIKINNSEFVVD